MTAPTVGARPHGVSLYRLYPFVPHFACASDSGRHSQDAGQAGACVARVNVCCTWNGNVVVTATRPDVAAPAGPHTAIAITRIHTPAIQNRLHPRDTLNLKTPHLFQW